MKKETGNIFCLASGLLTAFVLWTVAVMFVDVQPIGPNESNVGFATINRFVHDLTGVHMNLYIITDWLGLVPVGVVMGFGFLGLVQWVKGKKLIKVDYSILVLGGFYLVVMGAYVLFEIMPVNYRPVLIEGILEVSYPSSTTMLVMCVMPTGLMQLRSRMKNRRIKGWVTISVTAFTFFMVTGRLISGVHWFSDIAGGALLSAGLVALYAAVTGLKEK